MGILNNMKPYLTVIIPSYNEKENIKRDVLSGVRKFMQKKKYSWEVIISDDGSTDGSKEIIEKQIKSAFRVSMNDLQVHYCSIST